MPYIWKAPPDESPINIQQLISFQKSLTMTPQNIREYIRTFSKTEFLSKTQSYTETRTHKSGKKGYNNLEVRLHKTVEPGEVRIGSGRHGDGAFESGGDGRSSIQFPLVDRCV